MFLFFNLQLAGLSAPGRSGPSFDVIYVIHQHNLYHSLLDLASLKQQQELSSDLKAISFAQLTDTFHSQFNIP